MRMRVWAASLRKGGIGERERRKIAPFLPSQRSEVDRVRAVDDGEAEAEDEWQSAALALASPIKVSLSIATAIKGEN